MLSRKRVSPATSLLLGRDPQADAALGVARSMQHLEFGGAHHQPVAILRGYVDLDRLVGVRTPNHDACTSIISCSSLIVEIHIDRRAGGRLNFCGAADVIDVGVGDHDRFHLELVPGKDFAASVDIVAGVHHHGLARGFVAEDGAIALQHSYRQNLVDHKPIVYSTYGRASTASCAGCTSPRW